MRRLNCALVALALVSVSRAQEAKPNRFEAEIAKFEEQDKDHPPKAGSVLFVGSSSVRLWDLKKSFPSLDAINRGFGGSQISDSVYFATRIVAPYKPRLIVFYAGDNDIAANKSPQQVCDDFIAFVSKVREDLPHTPLVYISVKPSIKRWALIDKIRAANAAIQKSCQEHEHLQFLDIGPAMLGEDGQPKRELFRDDGLHMTDAGYKIWNDLLTPLLAESK